MLLAVVALLAACSTPTGNKPAPTTIAPPMPPSPVPLALMKKQSVRAFAAASATFSAPDNSASTNYATITHFAVTNELGARSIGVRINWPNWPTNTPYAIQKSTNLVDWEGSFILSRGDAGATLEVIDQEQIEFYRIVRAFFSGL
jgi:hypothetical protein